MSEEDYWLALEYRITAELKAFDDNRIRFLWCDGLIPESFRRLRNQGCITGRAWIGDARSQEQWRFRLLFRGIRRPTNWSEFLPSPEGKGWLRVKLDNQEIEIDCRSLSLPG